MNFEEIDNMVGKELAFIMGHCHVVKDARVEEFIYPYSHGIEKFFVRV